MPARVMALLTATTLCPAGVSYRAAAGAPRGALVRLSAPPCRATPFSSLSPTSLPLHCPPHLLLPQPC
jgi:hypothetical protein